MKIRNSVVFYLIAISVLSFFFAHPAGLASDTKKADAGSESSLSYESLRMGPTESSHWKSLDSQIEMDPPNDFPEVWTGYRIQKRIQSEYGTHRPRFTGLGISPEQLDVVSSSSEVPSE